MSVRLPRLRLAHSAAHRAHDPRRARAAAGLVVAAIAGLLVAVAPSAGAASFAANAEIATQSGGTVTVKGWVFDRARHGASVRVSIWIDGRYVRTVRADDSRPDVNRRYGLTGGHGFRVAVAYPRVAHTVTVRNRTSTHAVLAARAVHQALTPGQRIIGVARRYVGARYVDGGAGPRGFDCSGYTQYAFAQAHVASLPHNAEAQRRLARLIPRSQARPGDLVFYLAGGHAFHVAIYAGNGRQYSAATVRDGVRYQPIWSSAVQFGTTWH